MTDLISHANIERLLPLCQRLWPILQQHPPGSAGRAAITHELDSLPAADRHLCDLLLDRMERVIRFEDAWFPFYQGELDTITPPKKAKRVLPVGPAPKQVWKATRARLPEGGQYEQTKEGEGAKAGPACETVSARH